MDEKGNMVKKKTYILDVCFQWDRDVFGRTAEMLGGQQSHVSAERVETILRAMAGQSTDTESADVHDAGGAVEVQWNRDKFDSVVQTHGERLQSHMDAEEVEAILHAMAYQSTGKVDIVRVSYYMRRVAKCSRGSYEIMYDRKIFDKTYNIMIEKKQEKVNADDMVKILHLIDYLKIEEKWKWACYDKLARKTKEDYKEAAAGLVKEYVKPQSFLLYIQCLLRLFAKEHGVNLTIDEKRKTLNHLRSISNKKRKDNRTKESVLRVEVSDKYRKQTGVQRVAEVLMEVMGTAVEVDIEEWKPEDRGMLERIISKGKETVLRIKCSKVKPGAIAQHMWKLKNNVVELDVSENHLSDKDWKTVGEMTSLQWLNMSDCNIQAGTIAKHMQKLNIVELDVSWNRNLSDKDWKTVGKMRRLGRLNTRGCNIQAETVAQHMQKLNLLELDVTWNGNLSDKDWKTVGEMTRLKRLIIVENYSLQAGTIAHHMQKLNLVDLNVSMNSLSNEDWKTVGEMTKLERLNMNRCNIQAGTIAQHMQNQNFVELNVMWNRNLYDEDWRTVGEMTRLERLYIGGCKIQEAAIAQYMQKLKNNLVELDVSWNKNLSDKDWETVGEMTKLEKLNISDCGIQAGAIAKHMQKLKNNLVELDVSKNYLCDEDWKTVGEMKWLEKLSIRGCDIQAGTIAQHMQKLNLVELDVSWNRHLSDKDWKTVGEMTKLKRLNTRGCKIKEEQFSKYFARLRYRIY
eukprot:jgi/Antlo1/1531/561